MRLLNRFASVLSWILRRDRAESLLDDEMRSFVEMSTADKIRGRCSRCRGEAPRLDRDWRHRAGEGDGFAPGVTARSSMTSAGIFATRSGSSPGSAPSPS